MARAATATIVTNEHHRDLIERQGGRAVIIRDIPMTFEIGEPPPLGPGFRVMAVNTFAPDEPIGEVIAAARQLPDVSFHVTGDPGRPGFTMPSDVPDNVRFTGFVPDEDVARWFAAADVALLPYPRPFASSGPLALALAHSTPVLMSEALARTTGAPGALAVGADPAAIAARLRTLDEDRGERERLRDAARSLTTGRTWPEIARRHLELYGRVA
jgi:glycosyltransferase involved in cell wall biosynthesis